VYNAVPKQIVVHQTIDSPRQTALHSIWCSKYSLVKFYFGEKPMMNII